MDVVLIYSTITTGMRCNEHDRYTIIIIIIIIIIVVIIINAAYNNVDDTVYSSRNAVYCMSFMLLQFAWHRYQSFDHHTALVVVMRL